ncbi:MAG: hypothetical protein CO093_06035 [Alphaproteobacteria bacterium CG_4_9_14_3_um_filter_47_13]|nr:MAG: hypothetical protein CO093_06035 [Alphaproteobacteria bacterium CG_4_9_14_3_um_filter_47_13]
MIKSFLKDKKGIAATEFALMAPPLLLIVIGIFDYGMYLNYAIKLEDTAMATAQYIRAGGDEADIEESIILESSLGLTEDNIDTVTVDISYTYECDDPADPADEDTDCGVGDYLRRYVNVVISRNYETLIPYPGLSDSLNLNGTARLQNN